MDHRIRSGETLSSIAEKFHVSVEDLAKANHIKDPDKIYAGRTLQIPDSFTSTQTHAKTRNEVTVGRNTPTGDGFETTPVRQQQVQQLQPQQAPTTQPTGAKTAPQVAPAKTTFSEDGKTYGTSNGYPLYKQGDTSWGGQQIGTHANIGKDQSHTLRAKGCALSSMAMALSGITGQTVTPGELDSHMKSKGAMSGDSIGNWGAAGSVTKPPVKVTREPAGKFGPDKIDAELAKGKPVVIGVDYKEGSGKNRHLGHDGQTDHWILVTGKSPDGKTYYANDPATGKAMTLHREGNRLRADAPSHDYVSTGDATTFDRGPAKTAQQPTPVTTQPQTTAEKPQPKSQPKDNTFEQPTKRTARHGKVDHTAMGQVSADQFKSISPEDFRKGGTNSKAAIVVGTSEGNRTPQGATRGSYNGHTDPGNGAHNIGSFSVQGSKAKAAGGNPAKADEIQLQELANKTPEFEKAAKAAGLDPHNALLLSTFYDLQTQSPATATAFLKELPNLAKKGVTVDNLVEARTHAFMNNGKTGGWHNHPEKVGPDARRRTEALVTALRAQGLAN